ncbi:MAG: hypothetical protein JSU85_09400 [Candidatus Zixiibacteriota bacterium]|nr:MAG: hypothetical protein JSU85_09400 [candidate division Zixibacteria bacterium]
MQACFYASESDNPARFECASGHKGIKGDKPFQCLGNNCNRIIFKVPAYQGGKGKHERIIRNEKDLWEYLDYALPLSAGRNAARLLLFTHNVCPQPFITDLSRELFRMHQFCGDNRFPYPGGYLDQLAIYVDAATVIENEKAKLRAEKIKAERKKYGR